MSPLADRLKSAFFSQKSKQVMRLLALRFRIRTSPDQRLLGTSPKRIAAKLRPSSPFEAKASTIRPCFPLGNLEITYLYLLFTCPICDNRKDPWAIISAKQKVI